MSCLPGKNNVNVGSHDGWTHSSFLRVFGKRLIPNPPPKFLDTMKCGRSNADNKTELWAKLTQGCRHFGCARIRLTVTVGDKQIRKSANLNSGSCNCYHGVARIYARESCCSVCYCCVEAKVMFLRWFQMTSTATVIHFHRPVYSISRSMSLLR